MVIQIDGNWLNAAGNDIELFHLKIRVVLVRGKGASNDPNREASDSRERQPLKSKKNNYIGSRTSSTFFKAATCLVFCRDTFPGCIPILNGGNLHPLRSSTPPSEEVVLLQACGDKGCHMTDVAFPDVQNGSKRRLRNKKWGAKK